MPELSKVCVTLAQLPGCLYYARVFKYTTGVYLFFHTTPALVTDQDGCYLLDTVLLNT